MNRTSLEGVTFRVSGLGFRALGVTFRVQGLGFRACGGCL